MLLFAEQNEKLKILMTKLTFPLDAQKDLLFALERILGDREVNVRFSEFVSSYEKEKDIPYLDILEELKIIGEKTEICEYTVKLLFYLLLAEKLLLRYRERGIEESIYWNSLLDLRYKLEECRLVYGINGSFVAHWFRRFFDLTRFALGRLQFEMVETKEEFTVGGVLLPEGAKAINVHIPRTGTRLDHGEVLKSYALAAEMFRAEFPSNTVVFICNSWLLDPWNQTVLSPKSNLFAFCGDYKVVKTGVYDDYKEAWRLFDCHYTGDPEKLPRDSSFRRAYADRIAGGEPIGWGIGLFLYRDGKIVKE